MRAQRLVLIAAALLAAVPVVAQAEGFAGGGVGWARVNDGDFGGDGHSNTGWKAFVGGDTEIIGGEIQYIDFGRFGNGGRVHAWAPAVTAGFPLGGFKPYGKVGGAFLDVKHDGSIDDYHNTRAFWGVGGRFPILPSVGLRIEYERFNLKNSQHEDLISANGEILF